MNADFASQFSLNEDFGKDVFLRLCLGPLRYLLQAHDNWGQETLSRLRRNVECVGFDGPPDRIMHLFEFHLSFHEYKEVRSGCLPNRLSQILPGDFPKQGWKLTSDQAGNVTWYCSGISQSLWTWKTETPHHHTVFQLPWHPILEDMVKLGGALVHSGLATIEDRGYLFTAPPGGGKTTTLARMPPPWQVLGDDAVLVWANEEGSFLTSPLPTWGVLFGLKERLQNVVQWKVGTVIELAGMMMIKKAQHESLVSLRPSEAARQLYRAFSEHPMVVPNRNPIRKHLFHIASKLAKTTPSWEFGLSLNGDFKELLDGVLPHSR